MAKKKVSEPAPVPEVETIEETPVEPTPVNTVQTQKVKTIDPDLLLKKMMSKGPKISKSITTKRIK